VSSSPTQLSSVYVPTTPIYYRYTPPYYHKGHTTLTSVKQGGKPTTRKYGYWV
jgi:hypothetical protein